MDCGIGLVICTLICTLDHNRDTFNNDTTKYLKIYRETQLTTWYPSAFAVQNYYKYLLKNSHLERAEDFHEGVWTILIFFPPEMFR